MSLAVALDQTFKATNKSYTRIMVTTPVETVGGERIGFLPGDVEEKFSPHLGGIKDNLRQLLSQGKKAEQDKSVESYFKSGKIQIEPMGFFKRPYYY